MIRMRADDRQRLGDLDELLLADAQGCRRARRGRARCRAGASSARGGAAARPAVDDQPGDARLAAEEDVVGDRQLGNEVEFLMDDGDAGGLGLARRWRSGPARPSMLIVAFIVGVDAGEDFHQRRLAGAVLAHQRVDFAGPQVEADVGKRGDAAEILADAGRRQQRRQDGRAERCR